MEPAAARDALVRVLRKAYSGERGAAHAYHGHANASKDPAERAEIRAIEREELDHRERVGEILAGLGSGPDRRMDRVMFLIGRTLGALSHVSGWFAPMYGAGRLERINIVEYEDAARHALDAGRAEFVDDLLHMAEAEWEHEKYFREKCETHFLSRVLPMWPPPPPKARIRGSFETYAAERPGRERSGVRPFEQVAEPAEQVETVVGAGSGLGVVLDAEHR